MTGGRMIGNESILVAAPDLPFAALGSVAAALGAQITPVAAPYALHTVYLGLHRLTDRQLADLHEPIFYRHRASSFVITSNRAVEEWLSILDYLILVYSALDRLANVGDQIVFEGTSYRERLLPHRSCGVWPGFSIVHRHSSRSGNPEP